MATASTDDSDGYAIAYNTGFMVSGDKQGASEITLQEDAVKGSSKDTYKIFDITLASSFADNVARLGKPNLTQEKDAIWKVLDDNGINSVLLDIARAHLSLL